VSLAGCKQIVRANVRVHFTRSVGKLAAASACLHCLHSSLVRAHTKIDESSATSLCRYWGRISLRTGPVIRAFFPLSFFLRRSVILE
jgi:hypothetical protein